MFAAIEWTPVIVSAVAGIPAIIAAWFSYLGHRSSRSANNAVNNRPRESHDPKIYDLVHDTRERVIRLDERVQVLQRHDAEQDRRVGKLEHDAEEHRKEHDA